MSTETPIDPTAAHDTDVVAQTSMTDPRLLTAVGVKGYAQVALRRVKEGDLGSLPVLFGLLVIVIVFQSMNSTFLNPFNLVSLASQIASLGIIAMGVTLVLLLGEIDLSVGSVSGVAAATLLVMNVRYEYSPMIAILAAVGAGIGIGLLHGVIFAKIGVPSFIVTLAGLLAWQGVQLKILGKDGTLNLPPEGKLLDIGQFQYVNETLAYALGAALPLVYLASQLVRRRRLAAAELPAPPLWLPLIVAGVLVALLETVVYQLYRDRGLPLIFLFMIVLVVTLDWILRRTKYGRNIFAVGGNIEAARRAGINVDAIKISVFVLASTLAAIGGVVASMRLGFANQQSGSGDVLINAIAAAVIGGTSLFGGRTRLYAALLGAVVIGAIANGLELLNLSSSIRYVVTGSVLLLAVTVDALAQRGRQNRGR